AELTIAEIVMLMRRIFPRSVKAHAGQWDKSATDSYEVRGKTLGIVGYGNIGSQLAVLAEAMGMRVIYYDHTDKLRHGNVEPADDLLDLLARADVVSLHLPETPSTHGLIGAREIAAMKRGAYLINNARGTIVDLDALAGALRSGHLRGAAVDVFPVEPSSNAEAFVTP
ncbi:MAG: NAD(P)-dependent oxidoreductase, partial [Pyrinomonadaceae bacterium]